MFTQRAGLLGFVAFCFYLIAVVNSLPGFYYLLSWMSLGLLAASLGIALLSLIGLDCQWRLGQSRGYSSWDQESAVTADAEEVPTLLLSLRNMGTLNKTGILLEVQFRSVVGAIQTPPKGSSRKVKALPREEITVHRYLLEAVPSGSSLEVSLPLTHLPRGRHEVVQLSLIGSDVLGLFRTRRRLLSTGENKREFLVGPPLVVEPMLVHTAGRGRLATGSHRVQRFGMGDEVRGTRPYVHGDDMRHVHWQSTARAGDFVVREWEHTGHSAVLVVWDGAEGTTWGQGQFDTTEISLSLVASLCVTLSRAGIPCALACLGEDATYVDLEERVQSQLLSEPQFVALAGARALRIGDATQALELASRGRSREFDVVFWVTASLSPTLPDAIRRQGGRVQTRLALVDGASVRSSASDSRSTKNAVEKVDGSRGTGPSIPVTEASYDAQEHALRESGALVTRVAPHTGPEVATSVRRAIEYLVEPM